jgi:transposase InsO family protein
MSATISPKTGRPYGMRRVCQVWEASRSSVFHARKAKPQGARRGPKPIIPDSKLISMIREDLQNSPFIEEGHRKVYYRLKHLKGVKVAPKRVLRLMREHALLSPQRSAQGEAKTHTGVITTEKPNELWGTDGTMVQVVENGTVWIFAALEHWNAECVGIHVCKEGDRFNALEPVRQGLERHFGGVGKAIAAGLALRCDHGSQYTSDYFRDELRYLGIHQSMAYVAEPQTNGVVERFWKTLKKQVIEGRIYKDLDELRRAVRAFRERYNEQWRLEKLKGRTPNEARLAWSGRVAA